MKLDIWVVYKGSRKNSKIQIQCFKGTTVDELLSTSKRKPLVPYEFEILQIGVGSGFEETFKMKYRIT